MDNKNKDNSKFQFTGLGIIFGSGIGSAISLIITGNVIYGGIGTAVGLVIGAIIDSSKIKKKS